MSQVNKLKNHLENIGAITPLEALHCYGIFRLAARIAEVRASGMNVVTEMVKDDSGKCYARYCKVV